MVPCLEVSSTQGKATATMKLNSLEMEQQKPQPSHHTHTHFKMNSLWANDLAHWQEPHPLTEPPFKFTPNTQPIVIEEALVLVAQDTLKPSEAPALGSYKLPQTEVGPLTHQQLNHHLAVS